MNIGDFVEITDTNNTTKVYVLPEREGLASYLNPTVWEKRSRLSGSRHIDVVRSSPQERKALLLVLKELREPGSPYSWANRHPADEVLTTQALIQEASYENDKIIYTYERPLGWGERLDGKQFTIYLKEPGEDLRSFAKPRSSEVITAFIKRNNHSESSTEIPVEIDDGTLSDMLLEETSYSPHFVLFAEDSFVHRLRNYVDIGDLCMQRAGFEDSDSTHIFGSHLFSVVKVGSREKIRIVRYDLETAHRTSSPVGRPTEKDISAIAPAWEHPFADIEEFCRYAEILKQRIRDLGAAGQSTGHYGGNLNRKLQMDPRIKWTDLASRARESLYGY